MPAMRVARTVTVDLDEDVVDLDQLEAVVVEFARTAPSNPVGTAIENMLEKSVTDRHPADGGPPASAPAATRGARPRADRP